MPSVEGNYKRFSGLNRSSEHVSRNVLMINGALLIRLHIETTAN